ncbi:NAD(P)-dependent oxidoreductase [Liquorilactobacillus sicerae]|uniref:NAD(P)-dependent oxidoreductase n=1 Tax=Liquorilactobacillus sicerae TaxID=1416943 RepID=UPI0024807861|nr:NAD(P)-dependent oxidoreductase [Liquorilactobacillus sicerae]
MIKALLLVQPQKQQLEKLTKAFPQIIFSTDPSIAATTEIVLGWRAELKQVFLRNPNLKWVQAQSAGVDYLPLREFADKQILLTNASGLHSRYIAETVTSYILLENRGLREIIQRPSEWFEPDVLESREQTALIFGTGKIGREIGRYCRFLGMQVWGVNRHGMDDSLGDVFDRVITMAAYQQLSKQLKINFLISVLPGTKATAGFFDQNMLQQCRPGYTFINVGRGSAVKEKDLLNLLKNEYIRSAYLDVFEHEPLPKNSILWHHPRVFVTPHISGLLPHFRQELFPLFSDNLSSYLTNQPLRNLVDLGAGY